MLCWLSPSGRRTADVEYQLFAVAIFYRRHHVHSQIAFALVRDLAVGTIHDFSKGW